MADDPYDLERFVTAQRGAYDAALAELRRGRKSSHWMWFVFPQIAGLGHSPMARHYAIRSLGEARAYLDHAVLGERLRTCVAALAALPATADAERVMGGIDAIKLRSSLTLFEAAGSGAAGSGEADGAAAFAAAIDRWFDGVRDPATLDRLAAG